MRRQLAAAGMLLLAIGCAHGDEASQSADGKNAEPPSDSAARAKAPRSPPLVASPSELLEPRSQETIARALKANGVVERDGVRGEQLGAAIRKFQEGQGLAVTGYPDHETLRRLGIDPKDVETSLGSLPGTRPGETHSGVSNPSTGAGKGGSGDQESRKGAATHNDAPPKDPDADGKPPKESH
jgi:peptidoglycan hydrolase-like protein with peptidoglycan-binding domain